MSADSSQLGQRAALNALAARSVSAPEQLRANRAMTFYGTVAVSIMIALSPSLFFSFGYHNDFNAWAYDVRHCCTYHPETRILVAIGRYFGAYGQNLQFWTIRSLRDLWLWRLVGILSTALLAIYYLHIVSLRRPPTWQNACLTVAVFTLPTMQFQAIWVSMYMFWTPPMLLSLAAADLILTATEQAIFVDWRSVQRPLLFVLPAFALLLAGLSFYPMSATLLLVPAAHLLVTQNDPRFRRMATAAAIVLGSAFVAYFAIHKYIVLPRLADVPYLGEYQFAFTSGIFSEAMRRAWAYLKIGEYFWLGLEISWFAELVALCGLLALSYCIVRIVRRSTVVTGLIGFLMACCLFLVAAAPLLIVEQFASTFRITFTMTAIELLIFFWLLKQLPIAAPVLASIMAAFGIGLSLISVYGIAASAHGEYVRDKRAVAALSPNAFHSIIVLRRNAPRTAFGYDMRGDFGGLSPTVYIFDLLIGPRYYDQRIGSQHMERASFDVQTLYIAADESGSPVLEKNATTIDASAIYGLPLVKNFSRFATVSAHPRGAFGPINAVDGDPNTFWEVCGALFPIELELDYPSMRILRGYNMSTVEATERMPSKWKIWITSDHVNWRLLQEELDDKVWQTREARHYDVAPPAGIIGVKLVIEATHAGSCMRLYEFQPIF
jgi:hypothetical protein